MANTRQDKTGYKRSLLPVKLRGYIPPHEEPSRLAKIWHYTKFWTVFVVSVVGLVAAYAAFRPSFAIAPHISLDPADAFSAQFVITNTGFLSIHNVVPGCILGKNEMANGGEIRNMVLFNTTEKAERLLSGQSMTVTCPLEAPGNALKNGDVTILIAFDPTMWNWPIWYKRLEMHFRFITKRTTDGQLHWLPHPIAAP